MEDNPADILPPVPDDIPPVAADEMRTESTPPPKPKRGRPRKNPMAARVGGDSLAEGARVLEGKSAKKSAAAQVEDDERWGNFCENDPRREEFLRRQMKAYRILEAIDKDGDRDAGIIATKQGEAMLKANEQFARAIGLDLKGTRSASNLNSAAAIMEYVEEVDKVLDEALSRLSREKPDDYRRLMDAIAERDRPECAPASISA